MNALDKQEPILDPPAVLSSPPVRIVTKDQHPIRLELIDSDALFILKKLRDAGFAGYLVGGGVRDLYIGKKPKDFDISTDARPGQLRKLFPNSNTIGRRFRLVQVFFKGGKTIEVSTLRSLSEHDLDGPEEILAPNNTFGTLSEDARRRDLTINSLFFEIKDCTILDYVGGIEDLDRGIIRIAGDPVRRIGRDPVRMMRAIRHAARNNFAIEDQTWDAICGNCDKLTLCPPSRLRDELLKDLYSGAMSPWFHLALSSGIFVRLFPLYRDIFEGTAEERMRIQQLLAKLFATIDRANDLSINRGSHRQPDYFYLALLFVPWVEARWRLFSEFRKSGTLYQLAKEIREEIDHSSGTDLNLRRSLRQEMVNHFVYLAMLVHHRQPNNAWPKWLKNKHYFRKALLFYQFYQESTSGELIDETLIVREGQKGQPETNRLPQQDQEGPEPAPKFRPSFAQKTKGGIFGFKK
jgi:poly(A) polymerase